MVENDGWGEWSKYVLKELERLGELAGKNANNIQELNVCLSKVKVGIDNLTISTQQLVTSMDVVKNEIAGLKIKSGIWGAIGASIPIIGFLLLK